MDLRANPLCSSYGGLPFRWGHSLASSGKHEKGIRASLLVALVCFTLFLSLVCLLLAFSVINALFCATFHSYFSLNLQLLGVSCFVLLAHLGGFPLQGHFHKISHVSTEANALVKSLLEPNPLHRVNLAQLDLETHPWFSRSVATVTQTLNRFPAHSRKQA